MNAEKSPTQAQNELSHVLTFNNKKVFFEEINGIMMVNATELAKSFGQKPNFWLKTQQAKDLLKAFSYGGIFNTADLVVIRKGGIPEKQGTWFQEDIAILFAQWLSPEFYIACNRKLKELSATKTLQLPTCLGVEALAADGKLWYSYTDALRAMSASTRGSASNRKAKFPQHFIKRYGRNFISEWYFKLLKGFYDYKTAANQLSLGV